MCTDTSETTGCFLTSNHWILMLVVQSLLICLHHVLLVNHATCNQQHAITTHFTRTYPKYECQEGQEYFRCHRASHGALNPIQYNCLSASSTSSWRTGQLFPQEWPGSVIVTWLPNHHMTENLLPRGQHVPVSGRHLESFCWIFWATKGPTSWHLGGRGGENKFSCKFFPVFSVNFQSMALFCFPCSSFFLTFNTFLAFDSLHGAPWVLVP